MSPEQDGRAAAQRFRDEHGLGVQPLGDLMALIEQTTRIDAAVLNVEPNEHGLTMRDPKSGSVLIAVARTPHPMRQRSTLAHELAHVIFEDWQDTTPDGGGCHWSDRTPQEIRADAFARHLLVPGAGLRVLFGSTKDVPLSDLSTVVQRFVVSPPVAAIALHQAGHIAAVTKKEWMNWTSPQLATRFGWIAQYEGLQAESNKSRAPQRLLARAITGYREGVVSAQTIARLRGVPAAQVVAELRDAGIEPIRPDAAWTNAHDLPDAQVDLNELDSDLAAVDEDTLAGHDG